MKVRLHHLSMPAREIDEIRSCVVALFSLRDDHRVGKMAPLRCLHGSSGCQIIGTVYLEELDARKEGKGKEQGHSTERQEEQNRSHLESKPNSQELCPLEVQRDRGKSIERKIGWPNYE